MEGRALIAGRLGPPSGAMSPLRVEARGRLLAAEIASLDALEPWWLSEPAKPVEGAPVPARDAVAALRGLPVNAVAAALGHFEPIPVRTKNAIDMAMLAGSMDYAAAIAWLAAADIAGVETERVGLDAPATKAEGMKRELITAQLAALAAPAYRVTMMRITDEGKKIAINPGKGEEGQPERLWDRDGVLALIPRMIGTNATDHNLFVTPVLDGVEHVLVDDLDGDAVEEIRGGGYRPALIIESSPGSFQMVLKVAKSAAPREAINEFFKDMNRAWGDQKITGLTHGFRLAGFENRKQKHRAAGRYPWVRLIHAENVLCRRSAEVVQAYG